MNPSATTDDGDLPVDDWRRIDSACDRFEAAWRAGGRPDPAPFLAEVAGPARVRLLRELLAIELESRRRGGERPDATEFAARFPEEVAVIDGVFTELGLARGTRSPRDGMGSARAPARAHRDRDRRARGGRRPGRDRPRRTRGAAGGRLRGHSASWAGAAWGWSTWPATWRWTARAP